MPAELGREVEIACAPALVCAHNGPRQESPLGTTSLGIRRTPVARPRRRGHQSAKRLRSSVGTTLAGPTSGGDWDAMSWRSHCGGRLSWGRIGPSLDGLGVHPPSGTPPLGQETRCIGTARPGHTPMSACCGARPSGWNSATAGTADAEARVLYREGGPGRRGASIRADWPTPSGGSAEPRSCSAESADPPGGSAIPLGGFVGSRRRGSAAPPSKSRQRRPRVGGAACGVGGATPGWSAEPPLERS